MVSRFPEATGEKIALVTRFATQRERPMQSRDTVVAFPALRTFPMGTMAVPTRQHHVLDLRRHFGPAIFFEREGMSLEPRSVAGEAARQPSRGADLRGTGGNEMTGSRAPFPVRP